MIRLAAESGKLLLEYERESIALERRGPDNFFVDHPDFKLFLLEFRRDNGKVVEAFHGPDWYVGESFSGARRFDYPREWTHYIGHYRARNPETSNFRVILRKGVLTLVFPWGAVEPLEPLGEGLFHIGEDSCSPETLRFSAVVEGNALRADYSGCPYYRTFTP